MNIYCLFRFLQHGSNQSLARVNLPLGVQRARVTFDCGLINHAGQFIFQLFEDSETLSAETDTLTVHWPRINLVLPVSHVANTEEVRLKVEAYGATCSPDDRKQRNWLELVYQGRNASDTKSPLLIFKENYQGFWKVTVGEWILKCSVFEMAGIYTVFYRSDVSNSIISRSNDMLVKWSEEYSLNIDKNSIIPCKRNDHIVVGFSHPACIRDRDVVRLYSQSAENVASLVKPVSLRYVTERRVKAGGSHVMFNCRMFSRNNFAYCFKYISISANDAVTEQSSTCVPTVPIVGELLSE